MSLALQITDLSKTYDTNTVALRGVSLEVEQGAFFGLLGPNGAGKSTLIQIVTGLVNKSSGQVVVNGDDIDTNPSKAKTHVGVVPQEFNFPIFDRVYDIVLHQAGYYGIPLGKARENAETYIKELGLWDKRDEQARMLSGGMKRRLMIARALVHEPDILFLDEPTAGVDIEIRRSMWQFVRKINEEKNKTIILTTHYLEEAEALCRELAIIKDGRIIRQGTVKELLSRLERDSIILDLATELSSDVQNRLQAQGFEVRDGTTLYISFAREESSITAIIETLKEEGVTVSGVRNETNKLEELFVSLINEN